MSTVTTTKAVVPEELDGKPMRVIGPHEDGTYVVDCDIPRATLEAWVAQATSEDTIRANRQQIAEAARTALGQLRTMRDASSMTNAQAVAAIKVLARTQIGVIRLLLSELDSAD